jgi:hypothetical protein
MFLFAWAILAAFTGQLSAAGEAGAFSPAGVMEFRAVPGRTPAPHSVDGPLLGNGDMKVALGGKPENQRYFLGKNDLWRLQHGYGKSVPVGLGELDLEIPELSGASYRVRQPLGRPRTDAEFRKDGLVLRQTAMVAADRNQLWIHLECEGKAVEVRPVLKILGGRGSVSRATFRDGVLFGQRRFEKDQVDIPSGVAVAAKVLGAELNEATGASKPGAAVDYQVEIGREQHGGGRWSFDGCIDELAVYDTALKPAEIQAVMWGSHPAKPRLEWSFESEPKDARGVVSVTGKRGKALKFSGGKDSRAAVGKLTLPVQPVSVAAWIFIDHIHPEANYILSCGEWNHGVSLGLSAGKLRFAVNGRFIESPPLPTGAWVHVGGTADASLMNVFVNGRASSHAGDAQPVAAGRFLLEPGKPVDLLLVMDSLLDAADYAGRVVGTLAGVDHASLPAVEKAHADWWACYWNRSWIELGDAELELAYYRSLYGMAACSRNPRFPPGIFGWDTTNDPAWNGDYHLNYNHFAPFYALYSANRVTQGDPQDTPMLDFIDRGRWYAKNVTKTRGVLFPVGIGPLGIETTNGSANYNKGPNAELGGLFFQQRSNAAYALVNIAQRWRCTYDPDYARKVYPLVRGVADFWEDYLKFENGRYVIVGDAIHEGSGQDKNPILSLGLVRNALDLALDMSRELGVDVGRHAKWQHLLTHLSDWSTQEMKGKTVFRYTEEGTAWWVNNTLGIQPIYPANAIGLDSDPKWLAIARDTISVMGRWIDFNGSNSFFPAAVRVGYDPQVILGQLHRCVSNKYPNGFMKGNPHGIENFSTVPNTINEMLCMSHVPVGDPDRAESVIRVFPVWPKDRDARFHNIRCWGAFLVSSELKNGSVIRVEIASERLTFKTREGETLVLQAAE